MASSLILRIPRALIRALVLSQWLSVEFLQQVCGRIYLSPRWRVVSTKLGTKPSLSNRTSRCTCSWQERSSPEEQKDPESGSGAEMVSNTGHYEPHIEERKRRGMIDELLNWDLRHGHIGLNPSSGFVIGQQGDLIVAPVRHLEGSWAHEPARTGADVSSAGPRGLSGIVEVPMTSEVLPDVRPIRATSLIRATSRSAGHPETQPMRRRLRRDATQSSVGSASSSSTRAANSSDEDFSCGKGRRGGECRDGDEDRDWASDSDSDYDLEFRTTRYISRLNFATDAPIRVVLVPSNPSLASSGHITVRVVEIVRSDVQAVRDILESALRVVRGGLGVSPSSVQLAVNVVKFEPTNGRGGRQERDGRATRGTPGYSRGAFGAASRGAFIAASRGTLASSYTSASRVDLGRLIISMGVHEDDPPTPTGQRLWMRHVLVAVLPQKNHTARFLVIQVFCRDLAQGSLLDVLPRDRLYECNRSIRAWVVKVRVNSWSLVPSDQELTEEQSSADPSVTSEPNNTGPSIRGRVYFQGRTDSSLVRIGPGAELGLNSHTRLERLVDLEMDALDSETEADLGNLARLPGWRVPPFAYTHHSVGFHVSRQLTWGCSRMSEDPAGFSVSAFNASATCRSTSTWTLRATIFPPSGSLNASMFSTRSVCDMTIFRGEDSAAFQTDNIKWTSRFMRLEAHNYYSWARYLTAHARLIDVVALDRMADPEHALIVRFFPESESATGRVIVGTQSSSSSGRSEPSNVSAYTTILLHLTIENSGEQGARNEGGSSEVERVTDSVEPLRDSFQQAQTRPGRPERPVLSPTTTQPVRIYELRGPDRTNPRTDGIVISLNGGTTPGSCGWVVML